jgi:hypothetical protein
VNAAEEPYIAVRKMGDILMRELASAQVSESPGDKSSENLRSFLLQIERDGAR